MLGNFDLINEIYDNFSGNAAEIRLFIANFRKIIENIKLSELSEEQLAKLSSLVEAVIGRVPKSNSTATNRPFTSMQADIYFGLQWFLNECLSRNLHFERICRKILHLGLKPSVQHFSVDDEWLQVDLQLSSNTELVAADEIDEETLIRLAQRHSNCLRQILKNNTSSKRIIALFFDSHFDAELLPLLFNSKEVNFIGDKLARLPVLQLQSIPFDVMFPFSGALLLNALIEMGPAHPDQVTIKSFTEQFLRSNLSFSFDVHYCTLMSSFMVAYSEDHATGLDALFLNLAKSIFSTIEQSKAKIALCRGIAANVKRVISDLIDVLQQNLFYSQSNKLKWNILVALKAAVGVHELDYAALKSNWLSVLEGLENFKVALNYTQLLCSLASFNDEILISSKQDFEVLWNSNSKIKALLELFPDESVAESGEKLSNLLQDILGSSDWLKGGF